MSYKILKKTKRFHLAPIFAQLDFKFNFKIQLILPNSIITWDGSGSVYYVHMLP